MSALPGKLQSAFTAGELGPRLTERHELKYRANGLSFAQNVVFAPQGGFEVRAGQRSIGALGENAARLFPFKASDGSSYDLVFRPGEIEVWDASEKTDTITLAALTGGMLADISFAQQRDTMLLFHEDLQSQRIAHRAADDWTLDDLPYENLPSWDYGGPVGGGSYTNGVAAEWQLEFVDLTDAVTPFTLTVNGVTTPTLTYSSNMTTLATTIEDALEALSVVAAGLTVSSPSSKKIDVEFTGTDNVAQGDGWALSGETINVTDSVILSIKTTPGVSPGEDIISDDRGWPACGAFINERLLVGGLKSLKGNYMWSVQSDYFNFDSSLTSATGGRVVPMDVESGEQILAMLNDRNPVILTSEAEYWLGERTLSATEVPNHVETDRNGTKKGVPVVKSEGALLYTDGGVLREYRYTDTNGNYVSDDVSLLASHLVANVKDMAIKRTKLSTEGNQLALIENDGSARLATILRSQEVQAFSRLVSGDYYFVAATVNGRNEMGFIMDRPDGRRLERFETGLLLDDAVDMVNDPASATVSGLSRYNGRTVWAIADMEVLGPFTVSGGEITLNIAAENITIGVWTPPKITTLPLSQMIDTGIVRKRNQRIHTVHLSLIDTTSVAIAVNDGTPKDLNLYRYGMVANEAELAKGFTGNITVSGLTGYVAEPTLTITQVRPGRLTVRSLTMEAS